MRRLLTLGAGWAMWALKLACGLREDHATSFEHELHRMNQDTSEFVCCCSSDEPDKCEFLSLMKADGKYRCCFATMEGCKLFSKWWTKNVEKCLGPSVPDAGRVRAHLDYDLLDPEPFLNRLVTIVAPQFAHVKPLGEGGRSVVFLARLRHSGEIRALKMGKQEVDGASFNTECSTIKAVHHRVAQSADLSVAAGGSQHLLQCFKADTTFRPPVLELEYSGEAPWPSLASKDHTPTLQLLKQLFLGLHAFEQSKPQTVHHDIKWENTAVSKGGCLKIIDFDTAMAGIRWIIRDAVNVKYTKGYSLSSYVECGAVGKQATSACSLAYSYDAYSAGILASVSVCGAAEWLFYQRALSEPDVASKKVQEYLQDAKQNEVVAMYMVGFRSSGSRIGRSPMNSIPMKTLVEKMQESRIPKPDEAGSNKDAGPFAQKAASLLHDGFAHKLEFCESLLGTQEGQQGLEILDRLRSVEAAVRPRPSEVLASSLFRDVATGCTDDM